jgi:hypothetical protein
MAKTPENTPEDQHLEQKATRSLASAEARRRELIKDYRSEKLVPMYLSPLYRPYFGNVMRVMINGISIWFKVDGSTQKIPQTFADEIVARRLNVDKILMRKGKMANISANVESSPGEITLF